MLVLCVFRPVWAECVGSVLSTGGLKAAKAASTVLLNMFQYNKLHKDYKLVSQDRALLTQRTLVCCLSLVPVAEVSKDGALE